LSTNVKNLRVLNPAAIDQFELLTRKCWETYSFNFEKILTAHGWTQTFGWTPSLALVDFDDLLRSIGNFYLINVANKNAAAATQNSGKVLYDEISALAFCPDVLLNHLTMSFKVELSTTKLSGAILMVDISGFSTLSSELCSQGAIGLDSLYNMTNKFLGNFVDIVYDNSGDGKYHISE